MSSAETGDSHDLKQRPEGLMFPAEFFRYLMCVGGVESGVEGVQLLQLPHIGVHRTNPQIYL